jgi:TolB-like protein
MAKPTLEKQAAPEPTAEQVQAALDGILRSRCFEHAARASDFLRYVVAKTLAGETAQLKGHAIAVNVFGRPVDFDAKSDPLVRVEALRLRQRLTEYYAQEGAAEPVRIEVPRGAYAVRASFTSRDAECADAAPPQQQRRFLRVIGTRTRAAVAAAAALFVAAVGVATLQPPPGRVESPPEAAPERAHRTTIFVVPLESSSGSRKLDRLAAGLTEEIMLRLGALDLYVIAMQPASNPQGNALEGVLGAEHSYVLMGSVRQEADGARITLRIVEAKTGAQIWKAAYHEPPGIAEQPDRQSRIARDAAAAAGLFGPVFDAELALARRATHTLELADCQTRYRAFRRATDPALFPGAFSCFQSLVNREPEFAQAWAGMAMLYIDEHVYYSAARDGGAAFARARAAVDKALELDPTNVLANAALTSIQFYGGDPEFVRSAERTLALDPGNWDTIGVMGILLTAYGDSTRGLELVERARELSPQPQGIFRLAHVFASLRENEPCKALGEAQQLDADKWFIAHMLTAAAAGSCGDATAAAAARDRLLAVAPSFEAHAVRLVELWRFDASLRDATLTGLRKAGLELDE